MQKSQDHQRGSALAQVFAATAAIALVLGALGPALDDTRYADYGYRPAQLEAGVVDQLEAEARLKCASERGENSALIIDARGAIVCTDKHGRRQRSQITTLVRVDR